MLDSILVSSIALIIAAIKLDLIGVNVMLQFRQRLHPASSPLSESCLWEEVPCYRQLSLSLPGLAFLPHLLSHSLRTLPQTDSYPPFPFQAWLVSSQLGSSCLIIGSMETEEREWGPLQRNLLVSALGVKKKNPWENLISGIGDVKLEDSRALFSGFHGFWNGLSGSSSPNL